MVPNFSRILGAAVLLTAVLALAPDAAQSQERPAPRDVEDRGDFEMVLIHGLGSNAAVWDEVLPYLKGTFKVRVFEMAGHGATQPVIDPSLEREVGRLAEFITQEGLVYPTLVGHGFGGMVALEYALAHPADVHRLIMMDSAPRQMAVPEQKAAIAKALVEDYDRFVASRYLNLGPDPAVNEQVMDTALRTDSATFISLLMSSFDYDLTDRLSRLSVPLLVIGSQLMFPDEESSQAVLRQVGFDHARSLTFKRMGGTGHFMMLESPVYIASVLLAFGVTADYEFQN